MAFELTNGEIILQKSKVHWRSYFYPILWIILGAGIFISSYFVGLQHYKWVSLVFVIPYFCKYISNNCKKFIVTNHRVYFEEGIIHKIETDLSMASINNVMLRANLLQRILGAGDVIVVTGNDSPLELNDISHPSKFKSAIANVLKDKE